MTRWYVYLLKTAGNTLYTGITVDPKRRMRQHSGLIKGGAKALRGKAPLVYYCIFEVADKSLALKLEAWIKQRNRRAKEALIQDASELPYPATRLTDEVIRQMNSTHC
ncbi:GIY-YIG nuclease family protein [uncultured Alteromonas sp.]|jgi:putative endonuclease|uniref:GIY-YIG nuclease family protein n=1 Tax=uncultured Alteromonas sp. TaxID=179113 RepID=UPI0025DED2E5|nr:GIY-YIG nuclease family protein [uncultured Alteromonas sp.]